MTDRDQSAAQRTPLLSDDQPRTDPSAADNAGDNKGEDIWVANFMSRLTGTLRNIANRKQK
jgi:hypothetical protein